MECGSCGFIFRDGFDEKAIKRVYAEGQYEDVRGRHYLAELAARRRDARVRLRYLASWATAGRLLDVGAAGGAFVAEATACGFDASGVEPVPAFARAAREQLGVDVIEGGIETVSLASRHYDVITLWHVLEHLPHPETQLPRIAAALRPGGHLAVEVPNAGSVLAKRMGASWTSLEPEVHVNQFSAGSLRRALEQAGLQVCDIHTTTITPYLTPRARLSPRHLLGRAKVVRWLGDPRTTHPTGHELLRAVAARAEDARSAA